MFGGDRRLELGCILSPRLLGGRYEPMGLVPSVLFRSCHGSPFYLGARGNELAWQSRKWDSIFHFKQTQAAWKAWGRVFFTLNVLVLTAPWLAYAFIWLGYHDAPGYVSVWDLNDVVEYRSITVTKYVMNGCGL